MNHIHRNIRPVSKVRVTMFLGGLTIERISCGLVSEPTIASAVISVGTVTDRGLFKWYPEVLRKHTKILVRVNISCKI
jgi:hypothetical protein